MTRRLLTLALIAGTAACWGDETTGEYTDELREGDVVPVVEPENRATGMPRSGMNEPWAEEFGAENSRMIPDSLVRDRDTTIRVRRGVPVPMTPEP